MYQIFYSWGETALRPSLPDAFALLRGRFPNLYAVHELGARYAPPYESRIDGGEDGFGILVWEDEQESVNDPGSSAVASIYFVGSEDEEQ